MAGNYGVIRTLEELENFAAALRKSETIGFDIETGYAGMDRAKGSLDESWDQQYIVGFSAAPNPGLARYVPLRHDWGAGSTNLDPYAAWTIMKDVLESRIVVCHNIKFEMKNLLSLEAKEDGPNIDLRKGGFRDTMLEAYALSEWESFGLKYLSKAILKVDQAPITSLFVGGLTAKQEKCLRFNTLAVTPEVVSYACEDSALCLAIHEKIGARAYAERGFITRLEHSIAALMVDVEMMGVGVDWVSMEEARTQGMGFAVRMESAAKVAFSQMAGRDVSAVNLSSSAQIRKLLYSDLGLTTTRVTGKGALSTDAVALEALSREHPAVKKMLEYREVLNMTRRLDKWLREYRFSEDRRVHANYGQTVVGTGRFAASDPAIQQLPKEWRWATAPGDTKDPEFWEPVVAEGVNGKDYWLGNFRDFVIAQDGYYLLTFDYSQVELRVLAGVSQEKMLLDAFEHGQDVHTLTAAMMLGIRPEDVTPEQRALGKTQNFALLYRMGIKTLSERLAVSYDRAKELYEAYFAQFTSVDVWMRKAKADGRARGYAETNFGRKYTVWELKSDNSAIVGKGERVLVNAPIQGGAADIMKIGMVKVAGTLQEKGWWGDKVRLILNQHDSLTFEVSNEIDPAEARAVIEGCVILSLSRREDKAPFPKLVADWELGQRLGSSQKWKDGCTPVFVDGQWRLDGAVKEPDTEEDDWDDWLAEDSADSADEEEDVPADLDVVEAAYGDPMEPDPEVNVDSSEVLIDESEERTLVVEVMEMPYTDEIERFSSLVRDRRGRNRILLRTPEGDVETSWLVDLSPSDQGLVSMVLPGARAYFGAESVDVAALAEGLSL